MKIAPNIKNAGFRKKVMQRGRAVVIGGIIRRPPPVFAAIPNGIEVSAKKSRNGRINKISAGN